MLQVKHLTQGKCLNGNSVPQEIQNLNLLFEKPSSLKVRLHYPQLSRSLILE